MRFYTGRRNATNKSCLFDAKFFEFEEFSIDTFFCSSIQPQHAVQYVYFVTNEDGSANVEANSIQPQIVFTTEGFSSVVEDIDYENPENADSNADIWSKCNNALRDLLVFLVKKHHIEGLYQITQ